MNWNAIAAIGEAIGAVAVVASIAYLALQIRSNTRATKASAAFDASHSWAEHNTATLQMPDDLWAAAVRACNPAEVAANFSDVEKAKLGINSRALFQKLEGQYYLYKHGYLESGIWQTRRRFALGFIQAPFYRDWWESELKLSVYSDDFVAALLDETTLPTRSGDRSGKV